MNSVTAVKLRPQQQPVNLIEIADRGNKVAETKGTKKSSFKQMFSEELAGSRDITFSKHAQQRLFSRGIELSEGMLNRMADAIDKASSKGARETLVLSDEAAFVVSVPNRTVITAFDKSHLQEGIVTSIDSAVII